MLINIVHFLVIVPLCFHLHACNARNHGVLIHNNNPAKEFHQQKNDQKLNPGSVSIKPDGEHSERMGKRVINGENNEHNFQVATGDWVKGSGSRKAESTRSVSWRVPQKKRGEQETGFNLDYLPPRTHPPVHN